MDQARLRAWWFHRQGLDGSLSGQSVDKVLEQTGWARSVGGAGPYLGLYARCGAGREATDQAVARLEIHELPSARGCTYVVPASAFALALKVGQGFGPEADMKVGRKLGVSDAEIDRLCDAVVKALRSAPLKPEELRSATGGAARSLGEEGKKKGLSTTLPLALGRLQSAGEIRRISTNGRLDHQRYRYALWRPNPLAGFRLSAEECFVELARLYFTWIGPARLAEFQAFSALGAKPAKAAVEPLGLVPLAAGDERLLLPDQLAALQAFSPPRQPSYALVGNLDGILLARRDVKGLLSEEDWDRQVLADKGHVPVGSLLDLPSPAIFDRGRLVGLWEFDPEAQEVVWISFAKPPGGDGALRERVRATEAMIRDQLGDARAFSLDSPKSRRPRLDALRAAQTRGKQPPRASLAAQ
ncbi:MAG TPA: crosslink repair DNA glycosylase YcaQ family protein [Thermoanaerobaculia bacterium]|nr:crosslink repair DNA glycosylase YcaQ family protein [Thermoanaerobaculia bacterium]